MPRRKNVLLFGLVLIFTAMVVLPAIPRVLADWWWFKEIGYQIVFTRELTTRGLLFLTGAGLTALVLYINLAFAQRRIVPHPLVLRVGQPVPDVNIPALLRRFSLPVVLGLALIGGIAANSAWETVLQAIHGTPFGISDPVFGRDIGYYVFTLPAISPRSGFSPASRRSCWSCWSRSTSSAAISSRVQRRTASSRRPGCTWPCCWRVMFLLTALRLWLVDAPSLLYSTTGPLVGASYTDLHATPAGHPHLGGPGAPRRHRRAGRRPRRQLRPVRAVRGRRLPAGGLRRARGLSRW